MPIISKVDHNRRWVEAMAVGPVTYADVVEYYSHGRHRHSLSYSTFVDVRAAGIAYTREEARKLADMMCELGKEMPLGRTAILVSSDEGFENAVRLAEMVRGACDLKPFRDEAEARAWLAEDAAKHQSA